MFQKILCIYDTNIHSRLKNNCSVVISTVVNSKDFSNTLKLIHVFAISFEKMFGFIFKSNSSLFVVCIFYIFMQSLCYMIYQWMGTIYYRLTCVWHERIALTLLKQSYSAFLHESHAWTLDSDTKFLLTIELDSFARRLTVNI